MKLKEYIHSREHAAMGCGPMEECSACKSQFGESAPVSALPTKEELIKYLVLFTAAQVFAAVVIQRFLPTKKP